MTIIYASIGFFALAALFGLYLLTFVLKGRETPKAVVFTHGPFAATGLILLIIYISRGGPGPVESLVLFILAALGGIYMLFRDLNGRHIPKILAIGHGLLAVTGFIFLLVFALNK
ncbi:MAG: hypothetical protein ACO1OF_15645 [Adhaeribacter sp.]